MTDMNPVINQSFWERSLRIITVEKLLLSTDRRLYEKLLSEFLDSELIVRVVRINDILTLWHTCVGP